jgi:hypothetical protein
MAMQRKVIVVLLYAVLMTSCGGTLFAFKPPRRFSILGYLEVKAQFGADLNFLSRAVKNARQYGGDAIIRQNPGTLGGPAKFAVIKFES